MIQTRPFTLDPEKTLVVFDEVCVLCNGFAQFVARHDPDKQILFAAAQGSIGQALYRDQSLPLDDFETNLVVANGVVHRKLDAFVAVMMRLGWPWKAAAVLRVLPKPVADWLYDRIAKNRYAIFGKHETCPVPDAAMRERLIG